LFRAFVSGVCFGGRLQQYPAIAGFPTQHTLKVIDYKDIAGGEALSKFFDFDKA